LDVDEEKWNYLQVITMEAINLDEEIKSGELNKKETKGLNKNRWAERWFMLTPRGLSWWSNRKDQMSKKKSKGFIALPLGTLVKHASEGDENFKDSPKSHKCCFSITTPDGSVHLLAASTEEETGFWIDVLSSAAAGRKDLHKETVAIQEELRKTGVQEIPPDALTFDDQVIGSGASGVVKRGTWLKTTEVAVKVLKNIPEFTDKKDLLSFYKEIETLSKLRHSNIVQMYGFCRKENYVCLVTEYVRGGNLADCLSEPQDNYDLNLQSQLALNIVRGMVYLHNQNVIHRDLKPANILIESWEEGKVKVCDFGLSRVVRKSEAKEEMEALGSPQYAAPELNSEYHDSKVDVFSFAIILWEIAHRTSPWPELKFGNEFAERYARDQRPDFLDDTPFKHLIMRCWSKFPADRPAFVTVYEDLRKISEGTSPALSHMAKRTVSSAAIQSNGTKPLPTTPGQGGLKNSNSKGKMGSPITHMTPPLNRSDSMLRTPQFPNKNDHNNGPSKLQSSNSSGNLAKTPTEAAIARVFLTKPYETWEAFALAFQSALGAPAQMVKKLRFVFVSLEKEGMVEKKNWEDFIKWFTPLEAKQETEYENPGSVAKPVQVSGYDFDNIYTVCSPQWFHGFVESTEAQKRLKGKPDGTFLIRFSTTNPGSYALTVAYSNTVGHWRISSEKQPFQNPVFSIDGRPYKSLDDIVQTHRFGREPLQIKSPKLGQATSCFLGTCLAREDSEQDNMYYQNVSNLKK